MAAGGVRSRQPAPASIEPFMKISALAMASTLGLLWGLAMAIVGIANSLNPAYGGALIEALGSVYPGYEGSGTAGDVAIGIAYGVIDGAFAGWVIASVYNVFLRRVGG